MSNCCGGGCGKPRPLTERDEPRDEDVERFGGEDEETIEELRNCPSCGIAVWDEAARCGHCGEWLTANRSQSPWIVVAAGAALIGALFWVL